MEGWGNGFKIQLSAEGAIDKFPSENGSHPTFQHAITTTLQYSSIFVGELHAAG